MLSLVSKNRTCSCHSVVVYVGFDCCSLSSEHRGPEHFVVLFCCVTENSTFIFRERERDVYYEVGRKPEKTMAWELSRAKEWTLA
jgi:hypothetical protein